MTQPTAPATQPSSPPRARWVLHLQAKMWRNLMSIGMFLHKFASPRPPKPAFVRTVPTTLSPHRGKLIIHFYVPPSYRHNKSLGWKNGSGKRYPVILNFHGGGYTLGSATDDARWAGAVIHHCEAIVASVDYRLAPEFHFPTAVEDGVDALMYVVAHADELGVDVTRIGVSGFSSGGNMAFTVPLRLMEELNPDYELGNTKALDARPLVDGAVAEGGDENEDSIAATATDAAPMSSLRRESKAAQAHTIVRSLPDRVHVRAIVAWYPPTDYTRTRAQRRATNIRPDQELSAVFTQLFDESYLQPPTLDMAHPYLSPGVASTDLLSELPDDIVLYTVEYDMLRDEGERFRDRLRQMGKRVTYKMVEGVPHGWDKAPNPIKPTPGVQGHYKDACGEINRIFARA